MDLRESSILTIDPQNHWYYANKAAAIERYLTSAVEPNAPIHILDVGAGSGFFSKYLLAHSNVQSARCIDPNYENDLDLMVSGKPLRLQREMPKHFSEQYILMMDVLEHISDPAAFLRTYVEHAPPGATFLITVPAFQWLWSKHDDYLKHYRRYTLSEIEQLIDHSGLIFKKGAYYFATVFPLAAASRILEKIFFKHKTPKSQLTEYPTWLNTILNSICRFELTFMARNRFAGLTVFCLATKAT